MKNNVYLKYLTFLLLFLSTNSFSQYDQNLSYNDLIKGTEIYNGIYAIEHYPKGITFINKIGKQFSKNFEKINLFGNLSAGLIIYKGKYWKNIKTTDFRHDEFEIFPFIEIVKELENIDETYLDDELNGKYQKIYEENPIEFRKNFILKTYLYGWARKANKYAFITKFGELLTEFIYEKDEQGIYKFDTLQNKKMYVEINELGKEIHRSEFPGYLIGNFYKYTDDGVNTLINYNSYTYTYNNLKEALSDIDCYPNKCGIFSNRNIIFELDKGKINQKRLNKHFQITTNFYKNRAIACETSKKDKSQKLHIFNEKGKKTHSIQTEFTLTESCFNKYGQIVIYAENKKAVIDINGDFIIQPCVNCEISDNKNNGLYRVLQYEINSDEIIKEKSGYFNQLGKKIIPESNSNLKLIIGTEYNYLIDLNHLDVDYILDKENNLVKLIL